MLKLFNLVPQEGPRSETGGWTVDIRTREDGKKSYRVILEGSDTNIGLAIDRNDYEQLTTSYGINPGVPSRLISLISRDAYRPMITGIKNGHKDELVVLINFETEIGDVISDVRVENMLAVSYHIRKVNERSMFTALLVSPHGADLTSEISIDYGRLGGRSQITQTIAFDSLNNQRSQLGYRFIKDTNVIEDGIKTKKIILPRLTLDSICVNN